jgi:Carbohydrate/starch-binding module (family 21)
VERILSWQLAYSCNTDNCQCESNKNTKQQRVSFADDEQLASVRIIQEDTDEPPLLLQFSRLNESQTVKKSSLSLKINFDQPIGNYLMFYRKLSQNYVSLENVIVVSDLQLVGTVKTKNIGAAEKSVVLRCTFDGWRSFSDTACRSIQSNVAACQYDTYEFSLTVPQDVKPDTPNLIQFAICYTADQQQYWDNNGGCNVTVIEVAYRNTIDNQIIRETSCEFASWSDANIELPYW